MNLPDLPDIDWQHHGRTIRTDAGLQVNGLIVHLYIGRLSIMWNRKDRSCSPIPPEEGMSSSFLRRTPGSTSTGSGTPMDSQAPYGSGASNGTALSEIPSGYLDTAQLLSLMDHTLTHWLLNRDPECKWCR